MIPGAQRGRSKIIFLKVNTTKGRSSYTLVRAKPHKPQSAEMGCQASFPSCLEMVSMERHLAQIALSRLRTPQVTGICTSELNSWVQEEDPSVWIVVNLRDP